MKRFCPAALSLAVLFLFNVSCSMPVRLDRPKGEHYPRILGDGVLFTIEAPEAVQVNIAGTFNGWNQYTTELARDDKGVWSVKIPLKKGSWYAYKYIVDGYWISDPENPDAAPDGHNGYVSIIVVF